MYLGNSHRIYGYCSVLLCNLPRFDYGSSVHILITKKMRVKDSEVVFSDMIGAPNLNYYIYRRAFYLLRSCYTVPEMKNDHVEIYLNHLL